MASLGRRSTLLVWGFQVRVIRTGIRYSHYASPVTVVCTRTSVPVSEGTPYVSASVPECDYAARFGASQKSAFKKADFSLMLR